PLCHSRIAASWTGSGIDGATIPDLPLDELTGPPGAKGTVLPGDTPEPPAGSDGAAEPAWADAADEAGVETVLLAALTTPEDRLAAICARTRGSVYGASPLGVT